MINMTCVAAALRWTVAAVLLGAVAGPLGGCAPGEPAGCGPATRGEAETANQAFFEEYATDGGYRAGITGHGLSEDGEGWFILVLVSAEQPDSADRPGCYEGVPVEYETGGPFQGG